MSVVMCSSLGTSVASPNLARMALETSRVTGPGAADRQRDRRLGRPARAVWVEGQVAQVSRRPGMNTVFMTLRDAVADISIPVTCSRTLFDGSIRRWSRARASWCTPSRPTTPTAARCRSTPATSRWSASGAARAPRAPSSAAGGRGTVRPRLKRRLPFLPGTVGLVTAPRAAGARRAGERPAPLAAVRFEVAYPRCRVRARRPRSSRRSRRLDRDDAVEVIVVARGGGSVEDLLPFSDEALVRAVARVRTPVVSAIGHEPDQPLLDLVADVRASTPTDAAKLVVPDVAEEVRNVDRARGAHPRRAGRLARPRAGRPRRAPLPPCARRPAQPARRPQRGGRALRDRARRSLRHSLDRAADDVGHQRARAQALSPWPRSSAGTPSCRMPTVTSSRRSPGSPLSSGSASGSPTAGSTPPPSAPSSSRRPMAQKKTSETTPAEQAEETPSYEAAREELVEVVRALEAGGTTLEESLALWERGEKPGHRLPGLARRRPSAPRRRDRGRPRPLSRDFRRFSREFRPSPSQQVSIHRRNSRFE